MLCTSGKFFVVVLYSSANHLTSQTVKLKSYSVLKWRRFHNLTSFLRSKRKRKRGRFILKVDLVDKGSESETSWPVRSCHRTAKLTKVSSWRRKRRISKRTHSVKEEICCVCEDWVLYRFQGSRERKLNSFNANRWDETERKKSKRNAAKLPAPWQLHREWF